MPVDYSTLFNTQLSPEEETAFQEWATKNGKMKDLYDYDLRGAYKSGAAKKEGHMPDTFKKPNHPTFSSESIYSDRKLPGGRWVQQDGKWIFEASPTNIRFHGENGLQNYFNEAEPDSVLILPGSTLQPPMIGIRG